MPEAPFRLAFRVCDRRFAFLWDGPGQRSGRWNQTGDEPIHYLASSPVVAWAEWLRHEDIDDPADLEGIAAALWAVLIPETWGPDQLAVVSLPLHTVLGSTEAAAQARLDQVAMLKRSAAKGLKAPTAALRVVQSHPCLRVEQGANQLAALPVAAEVIVLWCAASDLAGWCCVPEGRPGAELLPLVRRGPPHQSPG